MQTTAFTGKTRLLQVFACYLILLLVIVARLVFIQLMRHRQFVELAQRQHQSTQVLPAQRGYILDRNDKMLAMNLNVFSVYAAPRAMRDKALTAALLADILGGDVADIEQRLRRDKAFIWIRRRIPDEQAQQIIDRNIPHVGLRKESRRYYPNERLGAHIIGFSNIDNQGIEGVELRYNQFLEGRAGRRMVLRDAKQRVLSAFEYHSVPAEDGATVVLTIDEVIQHIAEEALNDYFAQPQQRALAACVLVMDPRNGEILALANYPGYDLNAPEGSTSDSRRNRAVCDVFEPGSTFKIITAAAALEEKKVSLNEIFFCENGQYRISRHILHDHKPYGDLSFVEVIQYSSNIGTVKIAQKLGPQLLYDYVTRFGFGARSGIDLPGEVNGLIRPPRQWSRLSIAAIPIGHEVTATVVQMARAMAVIANGGFLVRPHIMKEIRDSAGRLTLTAANVLPQPVISRQTAATMADILSTVVEEGTGKKALVPGYRSAGKTGTAQKVLPGGGYSHRNFVASFIGFAPVDDPRVVIAVIVDDPKPLYYGGLVAAPLFSRIAERTLNYLQIAPAEQPPVTTASVR